MKPALRRVHRRLWTVLAVLVPAILVVGLLARQDGPREAPAVRLAAPPGEGTP